jgi:hypothetical protein
MDPDVNVVTGFQVRHPVNRRELRPLQRQIGRPLVLRPADPCPEDEQYRDRASHDLRLLSTPALRPDTEVIEEPLVFMGSRARGHASADHHHSWSFFSGWEELLAEKPVLNIGLESWALSR